ncbi:MAG: hypothetical protein AAF125_26170, partial [Chloroflexota bacterium]
MRSVSFAGDRSNVFIDLNDGTRVSYSVRPLVLFDSVYVWALLALSVGVICISSAFLVISLAANNANATRKIVVAVAMSIAGIVVSLGLLEAGMRVWIRFSGDEIAYFRFVASPREIATTKRNFDIYPILGVGLLPNEETDHNIYGFRNPVYEVPKPQDKYRILMLGGSTTYGWQIEMEEAYPWQTEQRLRTDYDHPQVEVLNGGVPTYYSLQTLVNLQTRGLEQEPDLVIIYQNINDGMRRELAPECYRGTNPLRGIGTNDLFTGNVDVSLPSSTLLRFFMYQLGLIEDPAAIWVWAETSTLCTTPMGNSRVENVQENAPIYFERNLRSIHHITQANEID